MKPPIICDHCLFETTDAAQAVDHMLLSRHGWSRGMSRMAVETGFLYRLQIDFALSQDRQQRGAREHS